MWAIVDQNMCRVGEIAVCVCRKPFEHTPICNLCNIQSVLILTSLQS